MVGWTFPPRLDRIWNKVEPVLIEPMESRQPREQE
jgi:hypothetical protein